MGSQIIAQDVGFSQQDEIDRLEINVERRLSGRVRNFRLIVHPDGLTLQGSAVTYHAKQLAQHTVMAATQLAILANEIEVEANFAAPAILVDF
jgi:hypothetical protein